MVIGTRHGMLTVITRQHEHHHVQSTPTAGGVASKRGLTRWGNVQDPSCAVAALAWTSTAKSHADSGALE
jgi:hypothetical protein